MSGLYIVTENNQLVGVASSREVADGLIMADMEQRKDHLGGAPFPYEYEFQFAERKIHPTWFDTAFWEKQYRAIGVDMATGSPLAGGSGSEGNQIEE